MSREIGLLHKDQNTLENIRLERRFWYCSFFSYIIIFPIKAWSCNTCIFHLMQFTAPVMDIKLLEAHRFPWFQTCTNFGFMKLKGELVFSWNNSFLKDDLILFVCNTEYPYLPGIPRLQMKIWLSWSLMSEIRKAVPKWKSLQATTLSGFHTINLGESKYY